MIILFSALHSTATSAWRRRRSDRNDERGQVLVLAALALAVLLGGAGLAIDTGLATHQRRLAQNAADAAALAGAQDLPGDPSSPTGGETSTAKGRAATYATTNGFTDGSNNTTVTVSSPPSDGSFRGDANYIEVVVTRQVSTFLLGVLNKNSISVSATSVARGVPGVTKCVFCVMSPTASCALSVTGNGAVTVGGGGIVVDSNSSTAGCLTGNGGVSDTDALLSTRIGLVGPGGTSSCTQVTGNAKFNPGANCGITSVPDPLAGTPVPCVSGGVISAALCSWASALNQGSVTLTGNTNKTIDPGLYTNLQLTGNGTLTLNPGTYVLTGGSSALSLTGNGKIVGSGVTIYFACSSYPTPCSSGQSGAGAALTGNGSYQISAPTTGTYAGMSFFYDPNNSAALSLTGNGNDTWGGTIYAKSATLNLTGNGGTYQLNSLMVVNKVSLTGNGSIGIAYTQAANYQGGGSPGGAQLVQ